MRVRGLGGRSARPTDAAPRLREPSAGHRGRRCSLGIRFALPTRRGSGSLARLEEVGVFVVDGDRYGAPVQLNAPHLDEAVRAAAWAVADRVFDPKRILALNGQVIVDQQRLARLVSRLIASGLPLI